MTKKQLRAFVRPMFVSPVLMGYTTEEKVEEALDVMFGKCTRYKRYGDVVASLKADNVMESLRVKEYKDMQ